MVDSVAFRAGGGINLTVTPEMSSVELVRSLMSAANAYFGFQPRGLDYRYTSLEPEEDAIRLLALFPDQQAEEVKCKIVHTTLSEKPHYEALSYTWGQVKTCAWITLEGGALSGHYQFVRCFERSATSGPNKVSLGRRAVY